MIEVCFAEENVPITVQWGREIKKRGGIVAKDTTEAILLLQKMFQGNFYEAAVRETYFIIGISVEYCVGYFATDCIYDYEADKVIIDLEKTLSVKEDIKASPKLALPWWERREILLDTHPMLKDHDRLVLRPE